MTNNAAEHTSILLVDDESGIRKVLGIALADMGYRVLVAKDGLEALDLFKQIVTPIVLSDIKMPGMDGIELLCAIKRFEPETEVIMITGHGDMDLAVKSLKFEATDFITKPISADALEVALRRAHERIEMRRQLKQYTEKLESLVAEKTRKLIEAERMAAVGQTVAGLSHAIKNITGGLTGGAFVVEKGLELDDAQYLRQGWRMVRGNVERIARLSLDLLNYSKTTRIALRRVHPNDPAKEVAELMRPRAEEEGVTLRIQLDPDLTPIRFDPDAMHRVLLNLVTNALDACYSDACKRGDRKVSLLTSKASGWGVEYRVCDTGCGMDAPTQSKLFRTFFTTKGSSGTGIGLMMTKNIIEKHRGTIRVRSKKGVGSEFIVRLPDLGERAVDGPAVEAEEAHEHDHLES